MTARTKSRVTPKYKTKYRVTNWREYEAALKRRGDVTFWFDEDAVAGWKPSKGERRPGGQAQYSDLAIVTVLTLRMVFSLPLRQAEGFVGSLLRLMNLDLAVPDHTTLSRRSGTVQIPEFDVRRGGPIDVVVDSTGLKVVGHGDWHARKHGSCGRRRAWRKLHLAVDQAGYVVASAVTDSNVGDAPTAVAMLGGVDLPITRFTADGGYDTRAVYGAMSERDGIEPTIVIPPRKGAAVTGPSRPELAQRDAAIRRIEEVGRRHWKKEVGAHQQSRAENAVYRYKRLIGDAFRARKKDTQRAEALIGIRALNRIFSLGRPDSAPIG